MHFPSTFDALVKPRQGLGFRSLHPSLFALLKANSQSHLSMSSSKQLRDETLELWDFHCLCLCIYMVENGCWWHGLFWACTGQNPVRLKRLYSWGESERLPSLIAIAVVCSIGNWGKALPFCLSQNSLYVLSKLARFVNSRHVWTIWVVWHITAVCVCARAHMHAHVWSFHTSELAICCYFWRFLQKGTPQVVTANRPDHLEWLLSPSSDRTSTASFKLLPCALL